MKKTTLLTLALICQGAFAANAAENIEYHKMGNYVAKNNCMLTHFQSVDSLIKGKGKNAKQTQDADVEKALNGGLKLISYENSSKFIHHSLEIHPSLELSDYYWVESKKSGVKNLYKVTDANLAPVKNCIVFLDQYVVEKEEKEETPKKP